jgi:cytochrome d ubiquinol oxidase subunit I
LQSLFDPVLLSRLQFAWTALFHMLWPLLTIGLSLFLLFLEALWVWTEDPVYYRHARFWGRLFVLNFGVGVVTGIPLEFQFGTNWGPFAANVGGFFGDMLGFEAAMAFMLEATFFGIMAFGWGRMSRGAHLFATAMVALGSTLSAFWIMVANSWIHTPAGGTFAGARFLVDDYVAAIFNPDVPWSFSHMWVACLETTLFVVGGVSAWYIRKDRHVAFFLRSFKIALVAAVVVAPVQLLLGDWSGLAVAEYQPSKLGGLEAHWDTNPLGEGAPWRVLAWPNQGKQRNDWALEVPNVLSLLATHSLTGRVKGLKGFPPVDQPPVMLLFYTFRVMIGAGMALAGLTAWTLWRWRGGWLGPVEAPSQRGLLLAWMAAGPIAYLAVETGWVVREVGRQPWIIYGVVRTSEAASPLAAGAVGTSLALSLLVYGALFAAFLLLAGRILREGPAASAAPSAAGGPR